LNLLSVSAAKIYIIIFRASDFIEKSKGHFSFFGFEYTRRKIPQKNGATGPVMRKQRKTCILSP